MGESNHESVVQKFLELENITVLIGTGLAKACGGKTMNEISESVKGKLKTISDPDVKAWEKKYLTGNSPNFEEFFNALNIKKKYLTLKGASDNVLEEAIDIGKSAVFDACNYSPNETQVLPLFRFLRCLTERKSGLPRASLFSLNYDLLIEHACDELGILVNDGFEGASRRYFNPGSFDLDYYHPSGAVNVRPVRCDRVINLIKLHGSIDWELRDDRVQKVSANKKNMFIYPSQDKLHDALANPFHEMFRRFAIANRRHKNAILAIGYGFLDSHVNSLILQALEQPHSFLVIVDPNVEAWKTKFQGLQKHMDKVKLIGENFENFCDKYLPTSLMQQRADDAISALAKKLIEKMVGRHEVDIAGTGVDSL